MFLVSSYRLCKDIQYIPNTLFFTWIWLTLGNDFKSAVFKSGSSKTSTGLLLLALSFYYSGSKTS